MLSSFKPVFQRIINYQITGKRNMLKQSINHILSRKVLDRYLRLPMPCNKILATYCWIDGSGINMRCKDRILRQMPRTIADVPGWAFDGSSTGQATTDNSDTKLVPAALYADPFRMSPHVIILAEVYLGDTDKPAKTNHRKYCNDLCICHASEEPWFGLEQEYTMVDVDGWGLGWPKGGGYPAVKYEFSYCGVGAKYIAGRDISEAHVRACLYAGMDFEGTNAEVMFGGWEWQIGTSVGIKAPDDLWMSRYFINRIAEEYGVQISFHPKPMGPQHPGMGMHHNFSTKTMRNKGGFGFIKECIKKLEKNHMKHMQWYSIDESTNRMRLSGQFETAPFDKFSWGVANRKASIRIGRSVEKEDKGFFEDRRPGADCDPYKVCGLLLETCLGPADVKCPPPPKPKPCPPPPCPPPPKPICPCPPPPCPKPCPPPKPVCPKPCPPPKPICPKPCPPPKPICPKPCPPPKAVCPKPCPPPKPVCPKPCPPPKPVCPKPCPPPKPVCPKPCPPPKPVCPKPCPPPKPVCPKPCPPPKPVCPKPCPPKPVCPKPCPPPKPVGPKLCPPKPNPCPPPPKLPPCPPKSSKTLCSKMYPPPPKCLK